jgi:hypothetical protein
MTEKSRAFEGVRLYVLPQIWRDWIAEQKLACTAKTKKEKWFVGRSLSSSVQFGCLSARVIRLVLWTWSLNVVVGARRDAYSRDRD